jgi:HPt (histidine-containing phosphotransfer) domain-containing protein
VQALRTQYRRSLADKADQLEKLTMAELPEYLHRLAGSAGMYEFENIAAEARELMTLLAHNKLTDASTLNDIDSKVAEMRQNLVSLMRTSEAEI